MEGGWYVWMGGMWGLTLYLIPIVKFGCEKLGGAAEGWKPNNI